jgi:hypothetical protein
MMGGVPRPLDVALFVEEFEDEVQRAFPPRGPVSVPLTDPSICLDGRAWIPVLTS